MDEALASCNGRAGDIMSGMQTQGTVLMRYHSAPSSVFASILHSQDDLSQPTLQQSEDSELARVCKPNSLLSHVQNGAKNASNGCMVAFNSHAPHGVPSTANTPQVAIAVTAAFQQQCVLPDESRTSGHLSSIFKRPQNDPSANSHTSAPNSNNCSNSELPLKMDAPESLSSVCQPFLSAKSNLIRHSSFPAEILSQLGAEERNEGPMQQLSGTYMPRNNSSIRDMCRPVENIPYDKVRSTHVESAIPNDTLMSANSSHDSIRDVHVSHGNTVSAQAPLRSTAWPECTRPHLANGSNFNGKSTLFQAKEETKFMGVESRCVESPMSVTQSSLFRQSSLPASLLSRLSFDGPSERVSSSGNSSEEDRRVGGARFSSRISGFWDEAGAEMAAFGQRKRGREVEDRAADGLSVLDSTQGCSVEEEMLQWNFGGSTASLDDSVLCRVRAKRGCATHPRSIAERVRRTKISEGMRKLQELVPNMEKQTNTATMLDEAVEYVKFLQQQKLSESQSKCNGMCRSKGST